MANLKNKLEDFSQKIIIALDGPSASGKGHIGRDLSKLYNLEYFESGIIYRGLAYLVSENNTDLNNINAIIKLSQQDIFAKTQNANLYQEEIGNIASKISVIPKVRHNLTNYLKEKIHTTNRILMEGRDIGTVVAPEANLKIFITADVKIRAERRFKQLQNQGKNCMLADVLKGLIERDDRDMNRSDSPLKPADGALIIDTTEIDPKQVIELIQKKIMEI